MNDNRQYLTVGIFVALSITILVGLWLWFSASNRKVYNIYQTVFTEPVDGISINSIIKYNGVEVGKVRAINLDKINPRNVVVELNILHNIPIYSDTYALMKPQGITGMSYIDLRLPRTIVNNTIIKPHNTEPYPVIISHPSFLYSLSEQAQSFTNNVKEITTSIKVLLNDNNIEHLANTLNNLDKISSTVARHSDSIGNSLDTIQKLLLSINSNSIKLNETFSNLSTLSQELSKTSSSTNTLINSFQANTLQNINSVLLPNLNQTVVNINQSSAQLEQLLTILSQNPSVLIRGKVPATKGPGE